MVQAVHVLCKIFDQLTHRLDFHGEDEYTALLHFISNAEKTNPESEDEDEEEEIEQRRVSRDCHKNRCILIDKKNLIKDLVHAMEETHYQVVIPRPFRMA